MCLAEVTPVSRTGHLLEPIQEPKQDTFSKEQAKMPSLLVSLVRQFNEGKSMNACKENDLQILMIYEKYGLKTAEDQLRQGIAKGWKSISLANYEKYNPDAVSSESPAEQALKRWENMLMHARLSGRSCKVWKDYPEEYEAACVAVQAA